MRKAEKAKEIPDGKEASHLIKRDKKVQSDLYKTRVKPFYVRGKMLVHKRKAKR